MPARSFSQHLLLPSVLELLVPNSLLSFPGLHGLSVQDDWLLLSRRLWQAQENGHKNAFCTHMNLDLPIPSSHCCHGSLGRCKDVAHYHSGAALPEFNDFGLILPFFPPFSCLQLLRAWPWMGYYCLCRIVPRHPCLQMPHLKSADEKLSRHGRALGSPALPRGWG